MVTTPGTQKDTKIDGDVSTTTGVNDAETTNMTQPNADIAHWAATVSAANEPMTGLDASEGIGEAAAKDGGAVADRDPSNNQEAVTAAQANLTGQVVPANLLHRLPTEIKSRIYGLVVADGIPGLPDSIERGEKFLRTLKLPALAMLDRQTRGDAMGVYFRGKHVSVQFPRDASKVCSLEALQELAMKRYRLESDTDGILAQMKQHAKETEDEFNKYLVRRQNLDLCLFQFVESLIATYNGRVKLNVEDGASDWDPRSFLVGFRYYSNIGFKRWKKDKSVARQLNASGDLDWTNFEMVRKAFVASLIKNSFWFGCVSYVDVLLHPMVQPVVKALCMFALGQREPLRWVEVIALDFTNIPEGELGVEWANLTNEEALYESEPDDGFGRFLDGRFLSGDEESQDGWEESRDGGNDAEEEEREEEQNSSDGAGRSENGNGSDVPDKLDGDDNSDGNRARKTEAVKTPDEADENPAGVSDLEAGNHSETQPEGV